MYSAGTVKQSLVVRKLAAHHCASDGHGPYAVPQSHFYNDLNPGPFSPLASFLTRSGFRSGTRKMGPASRLAGQQPENLNLQFSNEVPA